MNGIKNIVLNNSSKINAIKDYMTRRRSSSIKLHTLERDVVEFSAAAKEKAKKILPKKFPFKTRDAYVHLTERTAANSAVSTDLLARLSGYTDANGNVLPYLFVEGLSVDVKGKGTGRNIMAEIIKIAKEKYGGRLVLKPENKICNPSPFYAKCGLASTTERGAKEILDYFKKGIPFASGSSDPMYLPIK